jgi:hypothetical protein
MRVDEANQATAAAASALINRCVKKNRPGARAYHAQHGIEKSVSRETSACGRLRLCLASWYAWAMSRRIQIGLLRVRVPEDRELARILTPRTVAKLLGLTRRERLSRVAIWSLILALAAGLLLAIVPALVVVVVWWSLGSVAGGVVALVAALYVANGTIACRVAVRAALLEGLQARGVGA